MKKQDDPQPNGDILRIESEPDNKQTSFIERRGDQICYLIMEHDNSRTGTVPKKSLDSVHLEYVRRHSSSTAVWVILAAILAVAFYFLIENNLIRILGIGMTCAMALYLLYEHYTGPMGTHIVLCTKAAEIRMKIVDNRNTEEIEEFVTSLMTTESSPPKREEAKPRIFSPR